MALSWLRNACGLSPNVSFTAKADPTLELTSKHFPKEISPWPPSLWLLSRMRWL